MTSRSSTERLGDFLKVFHVVSWVSSWVVLFFLVGFWFVVFCVCVVLKTYVAFCSHLFSNMRE